MKARLLTIFLTIMMILGSSSLGLAEEQMPMGEMDAAQKKIMEQMQAYSTPNEHHDVLKKMVGSWDAEVKYWMAPGGEPHTSQGTGELELIMGGRFLQQTFKGDAMGQVFEGMGILGYDNIRQEYQNIWFDNMSTGLMMSTGQYNSEGQMIKEEGMLSCPLTNGERWFRSVTTFVDENTFTYETFMKDENGNEFQSMIINYTRK
ncbi:MAG: DUF1579 domain-containing protein [Candidatus Omnitrophica bacterium]|nr:DUF1579 domain-containing protein [Candidatus Omnitrophota bacterium]